MLESAVNHFDEDELFQGKGVQSLINKLNSIKINPCPREIEAVQKCADRLAVIECTRESDTQYIRFDSRMNRWIGRRTFNKTNFQMVSQDREKVLYAYEKFCTEQGIIA